MKRVKVIVHGLVQGVGFRYHTRVEANRLGVRGYVKNLANGTVEFIAEGDPDPVDALVAWAEQGPPSSQVDRIEVMEQTPLGNFQIFSVEY